MMTTVPPGAVALVLDGDGVGLAGGEGVGLADGRWTGLGVGNGPVGADELLPHEPSNSTSVAQKSAMPPLRCHVLMRVEQSGDCWKWSADFYQSREGKKRKSNAGSALRIPTLHGIMPKVKTL
jgi:hypothetical protein